MSDGPSVGGPPATTVELQSALPNRVLESGVGPYPTPDVLRTLLRRNFAVRLEAIGCSCAHFPPGLRLIGRVPFRVDSQDQYSESLAKSFQCYWKQNKCRKFLKDGSCESTREGTRPDRGREVSAGAANGFKAHSKIAPQERPSGLMKTCRRSSGPS